MTSASTYWQRERTRGTSPCRTWCYTHGMGAEISQRELRNDSGRIMRALTEGETFIITRNGEPVGELTPLRRHRFIRAEAAVDLFRSAPPIDHDRFRQDLDDLAVQDLTPRA